LPEVYTEIKPLLRSDFPAVTIGSMKKKATGRPPKKYGRKSKLMTVKMTPEQYETFQRAADSARSELSEWVREILAEAARKQLGES
jgi:predicted HicB family RNase H-like nuclease